MVKNLPANAGDLGSIPGLERSPGEGNGNPLQYSCLENSMDRGAWWATVHGITKESDMTERLNNNEQCICVFLVTLHSLRGLRSLIRDGTRAPRGGSMGL